MVVGGDRGYLRISHRDLRIVLGQLQVLPVLFRAVVATREREDHRIPALYLAQRADGAGVVGQRIIGEGAAGTMSERTG
jgi:hypothetical protein